MNDSDNVKMTINIGGEHIQLSVPFNRQDAVRDAEKAVAQLFDNWRKKWPSRSERHEKAAEIAMECDTRLASIISSQGNIAD